MNTLSKQELLDTIKKHNEEYRAGNPTITDSEYDNLVAQLKAIDPNNEWFKTIERLQCLTLASASCRFL